MMRRWVTLPINDTLDTSSEIEEEEEEEEDISSDYMEPNSVDTSRKTY